jgi:hypothetical protein
VRLLDTRDGLWWTVARAAAAATAAADARSPHAPLTESSQQGIIPAWAAAAQIQPKLLLPVHLRPGELSDSISTNWHQLSSEELSATI